MEPYTFFGLAHKVDENMELILKDEKHFNFIHEAKLSKYMLLVAVAYYLAKKKDEVLIACNVNQSDLYNGILDYLHKLHTTMVVRKLH